MESDSIKQVPQLVSELYSIVRRLEDLFEGRRFTLDGHLVGSIGEVLAAYDYGLTLLPASTQGHDARASDGRKVQIKVTQGNRVNLSEEPDHLIVLKLLKTGKHMEVYNGPGKPVWDARGKKQKNGQSPVSLNKLHELNGSVPAVNRLTPHKGTPGECGKE